MSQREQKNEQWNGPKRSPNGKNGAFQRNVYRQTMPSNSRYDPVTPPRRNHVSRFNNHNHTSSPTQSLTSNATNYEQPWRSPQFQPPTPVHNGSEEPRFRRNQSMVARKPEETQKNERPKINFFEFGKKFTKSLRKGVSKKSQQKQENNRLSAPVINMGQQPSSSTSQNPAQKPSTSSPKPTVRPTVSLKMQPEDRMKMFQKMGREQSMKVSNVQRMQRERQRDFTLVPGPGRACLEANTASSQGSLQSIDSMVTFSTPASRTNSISMNDGDVEPVFTNSLTKRTVTSAQVAALKKKDGPSLTSTPRLFASKTVSPAVSDVRSISESSLLLMNSADAISNNQTMYFSTNGLSTAGTDASTTAPLQKERSPVNIKKEVFETESAASSSHCPSVSSTPSGLVPDNQLIPFVPHISFVPDQLNDLWMVSKAIRDRQLMLEAGLPKLEKINARLGEINNEKMMLIETLGDSPSQDDLVRMWKLHHECHNLTKEMNTINVEVHNAHLWIPQLEMRRNELLAQSPPTNNPPGSFV